MVDNFGGVDWSGSGWSSKEVLNEINSIPEVKPPPKYSTTRAQPKSNNNNNRNNIVEGDFHYHNNIENIDQSSENSVQVDDFYYDYNFINFHEDLSDDFESDGKDSGDSRVSNASQEAKPTGSVKENADMETTRAPSATLIISTISKATAYTLKTEEQQNTNLDKIKNSGNAATKESTQMNSENFDDFLSEDFLLPVSTTRSPPLSTTQHSQTLKEAHDEDVWGPETTPETITQVKTEVQLDKSASVISQTTSQSTIFPTHFYTVYATSNSWDTDHDLSTTSLPASETPTPFPIPFLLISGNQEASDDSTSLPGTENIPPTNLEGDAQPSSADSLPATVKQIPTKPAFTEKTGTDSTSRVPSSDSVDFDYNEIVVPPMVRSSSNTDPGSSYQLPTNSTTTQHRTTPVQHMEAATPVVPILPTHPILWPLPVPTSTPTSASTQENTATHWVTGNWSAVSST